MGNSPPGFRNDAGTSNPGYFHADPAYHNKRLKLQQVPEEYAQLLFFFKATKAKYYLELGIGNGGSFVLNTHFLSKNLVQAVAVDALSYGALIGQNEEEVNRFMTQARRMSPKASMFFMNAKTDDFFRDNLDPEMRFDMIFIDADHSYEGAHRDYENALLWLNKGGWLVFHDIVSEGCPGVRRLWKEVKHEQGPENASEFIASETCGIGVIRATNGTRPNCGNKAIR